MIDFIKNNWAALLALGGTLFTVLLNPVGYFRKVKEENDVDQAKTSFLKMSLIRVEFNKLHEEIDELQKEVRELTKTVHSTHMDNIDLRAENNLLKTENARLKAKLHADE